MVSIIHLVFVIAFHSSIAHFSDDDIAVNLVVDGVLIASSESIKIANFACLKNHTT